MDLFKKYTHYEPVPCTREAVAGRLEELARDTSDPQLRDMYAGMVDDARAGRLHRKVMETFATGTKYELNPKRKGRAWR